MRRIVVGLVVGALVVGLSGLPALAFECVARLKEANQAISQAESGVAGITNARAKGNAEAFVALAKEMAKQADADHKDGAAKKAATLHYAAAAKAKVAKWAAEQAKEMK